MAKLDKKEVSGQEFILEELRSMRNAMRRLEYTSGPSREKYGSRMQKDSMRPDADLDICLKHFPQSKIDEILKNARDNPEVIDCRLFEMGEGHLHLLAEVKSGADFSEVQNSLSSPTRIRRTIPKVA